METLGRIPTEIEFGGEAAKLVVSIAGKVTGEVGGGAGGAKLKVEGSAEGGEATYTPPGGGPKIGVKGGPEGAGASIMFSGNKVSIDVTDKKVKAEVKAGDLVTVKGSAGTDKDGVFAWRADIQVGHAREDRDRRGHRQADDRRAGHLREGRGRPLAGPDRRQGERARRRRQGGRDEGRRRRREEREAAEEGRLGRRLSAGGDASGGWSAGITFTWSW